MANGTQAPSGWQDDLAVGIDAVDGEHRLQVRLVDALEAAVRAGRGRGIVAEILQRLEETTRVHFLGEELLMRLHSYERQGPHAEEHRQLMEQLRALRELEPSAGERALAEPIERIRAWLTGHIRGADRAFAEAIAPPDRRPS